MPSKSQPAESGITFRRNTECMKDIIRRILVPLDPSVFAQAATETACRIAEKHEATLSGVAVLDSEGIRRSLVPAVGPYYPMMIDAVQSKVDHADRILNDCLERFATSCEKAGVEHVETEYEGIPAQKLLESSIFYDLVVVGLETAFHFETHKDKGNSLAEILDRTITPIIAVPPKGLDEPKKVLIAFDGSFGAARALHDFAAYATPYEPEITLVAAEATDENASFLLRNASEFLFAHGFDFVETMQSEESISDVVNDELLEDVDLVVAGIHSRKAVKDFFVGSFTKELIKRGDTALFLSH